MDLAEVAHLEIKDPTRLIPNGPWGRGTPIQPCSNRQLAVNMGNLVAGIHGWHGPMQESCQPCQTSPGTNFPGPSSLDGIHPHHAGGPSFRTSPESPAEHDTGAAQIWALMLCENDPPGNQSPWPIGLLKTNGPCGGPQRTAACVPTAKALPFHPRGRQHAALDAGLEPAIPKARPRVARQSRRALDHGNRAEWLAWDAKAPARTTFRYAGQASNSGNAFLGSACRGGLCLAPAHGDARKPQGARQPWGWTGPSHNHGSPGDLLGQCFRAPGFDASTGIILDSSHAQSWMGKFMGATHPTLARGMSKAA